MLQGSLSRNNLSRRPVSSSSLSLLRSAATAAKAKTKPQQQFLLRRRWKSTTAKPPKEPVEEPSFEVLRMVAITQSIPFLGFGLMDNAILIVAGDAIDTSLGVVLGISTLCAAAIGNIISDLAGIMLGTVIEDFCANVLKLPVPKLSNAQRTLRSVRFANQFGMALGITVGCIIGMFPLLFIDTGKAEELKHKVHLEDLFKDVVHDAKDLVDAESTCLYLRVGEHAKNDYFQHIPYKPMIDGDFLYAMHFDIPGPKAAFDDNKEFPSRLIPLGRGIVSRAILTGEAWNIPDVHAEPDFIRDYFDEVQKAHMKSCLVVPVLDPHGRRIAVIRAMNKKSSEDGKFTEHDVQILQSLASHLSVSLSSAYRDDGEKEVNLRDAIRILKEQGNKRIQKTEKPKTGLFPLE